jgi:hypothetical protein
VNSQGAVLIVDPGQGRIWEAEKDIPLERFGSFRAPSMDGVFEDMKSTLPPVIRRSPRQRMESMMQRIVEQAVTSYRITGKAQWPKSTLDTLGEIARKNNDPQLLKEGGIEQVIYQGKALARHLAEEGENRQKAQDSKRTTRNWSGLY